MSKLNTNSPAQVIQSIVDQLKGVTSEVKIRSITIKGWLMLKELVPNPNTFNKQCRTPLRKALESAFPSGDEPKPGYYKTSAGKGKEERYEHLALWYATTNEERQEIVGDVARDRYFKNLPPLPEKPSEEQSVEQPQPVETKKPTLETMMLEQLDSETQEIVNDALRSSGMSLPEFVKQAFRVYGKTLTGKHKQFDEDLSIVPTADLLNTVQIVQGKEVRSQYYTHPNRAEELTKRAIKAMMLHNDNAPEKDYRWMITQTAIQSLTGSKPATIKKILEQYKGMIDDHNQKYELNPYHNRKGSDRKIENEIDLAALVPDGLDL